MRISFNSIIRPKPTPKLIEEMEDEWEVTLPEDYQRFIMKYNGCIPKDCVFTCPNGRESCIMRFLCLLDAPEDHRLGDFDINVIESRIFDLLTDNPHLVGMDLLPIASITGFGDLLCLDFRKDRANPSVCVWFLKESKTWNPVSYPVAENFSQFLSMLRIP